MRLIPFFLFHLTLPTSLPSSMTSLSSHKSSKTTSDTIEQKESLHVHLSILYTCLPNLVKTKDAHITSQVLNIVSTLNLGTYMGLRMGIEVWKRWKRVWNVISTGIRSWVKEKVEEKERNEMKQGLRVVPSNIESKEAIMMERAVFQSIK